MRGRFNSGTQSSRLGLASLLVVGSFLGSCGSMESRLPAFAEESGTHLVGWPPFDALWVDCLWIIGDPRHGSCKTDAMWPIIMPFYLLSVPVDLGLDVVLAPLDVITGLCGWSRGQVDEQYDAAQLGAGADAPQAARGSAP